MQPQKSSKKMDASVLGLSPSTLTNPVTPKPSPSDENKQYYQQLGCPNLSNPKKSMKKHYMSPTISAACKAVSSRKNILGERNEASESVSSITHIEKDHVDSLCQATPPISEPHDCDLNVVSDDLCSGPYDPVTNYLSARPQFLRYNPNRHLELVLGLGNYTEEGNDGLSLSRSGSFESQKGFDEEDGSDTTSSSSGSFHKQEDEDVEESDENTEGSDVEIKGTGEEIKGVDEVIEGGGDEIEGSDEVVEGAADEIEEIEEEDEEVEEEKKGSITTASSSKSSFHKQEDVDVEISDENTKGSDVEIKGTGEEIKGVDEVIKGSGEEIEGSGEVVEGAADEIEEIEEEDEKVEEEKKGSITTASSSKSSFHKQEDVDVEISDENTKGSDVEIKGIGEEIKGADEVIKGSGEEIEGSDEVVEGATDEIEESEEEDEEVEEEKKGCNLKGVLKILLVFLALVFFTSHIASVNQEALFEGFEDGYCRSQNNTLEVDMSKKLEDLWGHREEGHIGFVEGINGGHEIGIEEVKVVDLVECESGSEVVGGELEMVLDFTKYAEHVDDLGEVLEPQAEETEAVEWIEKGEEEVVKLGEMVVPQVEGVEDISDQMAQKSMSGDIDYHNLVSNYLNAFEVKGEVEPIDEMIESKVVELEYPNSMTAEIAMPETMDGDNTSLDGEILDSRAEQYWKEKLLNHMNSKTLHTSIVGVSILLVLATSLGLVFHFNRKKATSKNSSVVANTGSMKTLIIEQRKMIKKDTVMSEKYNSALASREEDESIEQDVYSSFRRMSLSSDSNHSTEPGSEAYHRKAPKVQLLGEFVVGEVSSSCLRSRGLNYKMIEGEDSSYAVSKEKKPRSKGHSVSIQQQPSLSEFSYMDSFSHGSYTPKKKMIPTESESSSMDISHGSYTSEKIVKIKEGGKDGEVKVIATPVRRSSRIRCKILMSP